MFKGSHFPSAVILQAVRWYLRFSLSYRDLEEMMAERGVQVDHSTIQRWVANYAPRLEAEHQKRRLPVGGSWYMDETYVKVQGKWCYLYRAVDKNGKSVDFILTEKRDEASALSFFNKAIATHGRPTTVTIDKSGSNTAALKTLNDTLSGQQITMRQSKYLNNRIEQDHRFIKRLTRPMMGFKSFASAVATLAGIELCHQLRKGQYQQADSMQPWEYFVQLAG